MAPIIQEDGDDAVPTSPLKSSLPPPSTQHHEPETKHHSQDSDALDALCHKLTNIQVRARPEDDFRDIVRLFLSLLDMNTMLKTKSIVARDVSIDGARSALFFL